MPVFTLKHSLRFGLLSAAALVAVAAQANAAGFYIQEQSVRGLGSAFSGSVTNLSDPSTIFFNPAGMTKLEGMQAQAGVNLLIPDSKVKDRGSVAPPGRVLGGSSDNPYDPTPVPNGFLSYQVTNNLWAGIGVTAPFGLASEYDDGWFGRFDSTKTELQVFDIQPSLAYKVNDAISFGVGLNIERSSADLRNQVNLGAGGEGSQKLEGDDWGFGYTIGVQLKPIETTTIGLNYKSAVHHDLDGSLEIATPAGFAPGLGAGKAKLTTPDIATIGVSHQVNNRLTIQGQASWFGWSNFDEIAVRLASGTPTAPVVQDYQNTWAFAIGAEYVASDKWLLRGGVQFDETPTTDEFRTSRTPDGDRTWVSLGATYAFSDRIDLDMAATYIHVDSGTINLQRGGLTPPANGTMNAKTEGDVGILALGVTYKF